MLGSCLGTGWKFRSMVSCQQQKFLIMCNDNNDLTCWGGRRRILFREVVKPQSPSYLCEENNYQLESQTQLIFSWVGLGYKLNILSEVLGRG